MHRKKGIRYKQHLGIYKGVAGVAGLKMALWKMIHESRCPQCRCKLTFIPNEQRWFCKNCNKIFPQKDKTIPIERPKSHRHQKIRKR